MVDARRSGRRVLTDVRVRVSPWAPIRTDSFLICFEEYTMTMEKPAQKSDLTPVQKLGEAIADRVERWMPSPFLFAIILTYVAAITAFISEDSSVTDIALSWYDGFWNLLQFAMQMVIILVTANVVAYHPKVKKLILLMLLIFLVKLEAI